MDKKVLVIAIKTLVTNTLFQLYGNHRAIISKNKKFIYTIPHNKNENLSIN